MGIAAAWCGPGASAHCPVLAQALGIPLRLGGRAGVALTFDDGPHPVGTPAVLEALSAFGATATFFLVGEQVARRPSLVGELIAAGHEPAVHAYRHRNQMRLSPASFADDLRRAIAVISDAAGRPPRCYRPPYGVFTPTGLRAVRRAGLTPLLWSRWGRDWRADSSPAQIVGRVTGGGLERGDVVLLHDADWYCAQGAYRRTVSALPQVLDALAARGLQTIPATRAAGW